MPKGCYPAQKNEEGNTQKNQAVEKQNGQAAFGKSNTFT